MKRFSRNLLLASSSAILVSLASTALNANQVTPIQTLSQIDQQLTTLPRIELLQLGALDSICQSGDINCSSYLPASTNDARIAQRQLIANTAHNKGAAYLYNAGDKIKFTFYDRDDLTGVYKVRLDGTISLPFLGNFVVVGKSSQKLENEISSALTRLTKRPTFLSIEAMERRPFYIVGAVNKAGEYAYVPNMNVLHALALAGGSKTTGVTGASVNGLQLTREVWKRKRAMKSLQRGLAKLSRLEAERAGSKKLVPTDRLFALVGDARANQILDQERGLFEQRKIAQQRRTEDLKQMETLSREELKAYRNQLTQIRAQERQHKAEFKDLRSLAKRGLTRRTRVYAKSNDISQLQGQASEVMASIARASRAIVRAQRDLTMLPLDTQRRIEEEIQIVTDRIDVQEGIVQATSETIGDDGSMLQLTGANGGSLVPTVRYSIVRPSSVGYQTIDADEYTRVRPGDILRVKREIGGAAFGNNNRIQEAKRNGGNRLGGNGLIRTSVSNNGRVTGQVRSAAPQVRDNEINSLRNTMAQMSERLAELTSFIQNKLGGQQAAIGMKAAAPKSHSVDASKQVVKKPVQPIRYNQPKAKQMIKPISDPSQTHRKAVMIPTAAVLQPIVMPTRRPAAPARPMDQAKFAKMLQAQLLRVGCSPRYIDGIWGVKSRAALKAFNRATSANLNAGQPNMKALLTVKSHSGRACTRQYASR